MEKGDGDVAVCMHFQGLGCHDTHSPPWDLAGLNAEPLNPLVCRPAQELVVNVHRLRPFSFPFTGCAQFS